MRGYKVATTEHKLSVKEGPGNPLWVQGEIGHLTDACLIF
jgi:hypothetical protein